MKRDYRFLTNCINCPGPDPGDAINAMTEASTQITRKVFMQYVNKDDRLALEKQLGYETHYKLGLTMGKDWHPGYFRSVFRGVPCVYFDHSRIEYIFTRRK
jgi:hypothetical protein